VGGWIGTLATSRDGGTGRKIRFAIVLLVAAASCTGFAQAAVGDGLRQPQETVFALAESFYGQGQYQDAVTEYKRYLFLAPDGELVDSAYHRIALCLREEERWDESIALLDQSILLASSPVVRFERQCDVLATMIAAGRYGTAEFRLARLHAGTQEGEAAERHRSLDYYGVLLYVLTHRWEEAGETIGSIVAYEREHHTDEAPRWEEVRQLVEDAAAAPRISPQRARILSLFIPGGGQAYAGDGRSGLGAFVVNLASAGLAVYGLSQHRFLETGLFLLYVAGRFYGGNLYNAEEAARSRNERVDAEFTAVILERVGGLSRAVAD
jgi:tetratricopeptide (TPR) repeat protein